MVVTRAEPGRLDELLVACGARVVAAPAITFADARDGGAALRDAAARIEAGDLDWVVVTSATGVGRLRAALGDADPGPGVAVAAIGPATARALTATGFTVDLVADRAVGEGLVEVFPRGPGRVVRIRPEEARDVVADGLRAKSWIVDEVVAYRTVPAVIDADTARCVRAADAITFTSPSTVDSVVASVGASGLPDVVASIGPVTTRALAGHAIAVTCEADPHTVDGLCTALARVFDGA